MKIIHCADIHLDSALNANLGQEKADGRRRELLYTFQKLIDYGIEQSVDAILIAGDLFDTTYPSYNTVRMFYDLIRDASQIQFYYLKGNHDAFGGDIKDSKPDNLYLFDETWATYILGKRENITISGMEFNGVNNNDTSQLQLSPNTYNIVMVHGQASEYQLHDNRDAFLLSSYRHKNIDYLALGHIHSYQLEELDPRGIWCYCGCLEPRGFDECGKKGFVLLEIDEELQTSTIEFIKFSKREVYYYDINVTGASTEYDIEQVVKDNLRRKQISKESICKLNLVGELELDCNRNMKGLEQKLNEDYYFIKLVDKTRIKVSYERFALDESLKGEFVRIVNRDPSLSEEEKEAIIYSGISFLQGRGDNV